MRILLVEDTRDVGEAINQRLVRVGHSVDWETDGLVAAEILDFTGYDLIILDVMLPGLGGFDILRRLRAAKKTVPVLVLTARSEIEDRVSALDLGADDYLVKPFDFRELEARVRVLLRRNSGETTNIIVCGNLQLDRHSRNVRIGNREVQLKRREIAILEVFASRPGRLFSKDELMDTLFGFDEGVNHNAVELYISRIRKKIEGSGVSIMTQRGMGYQLVIDESA
ncbi:response regulator transcription factor [Brucella pseudogrignonensis]|uniref:response regulator transcription factor n=1 Tax=Brucella pseudogrignonensis TaxID=419475 RepID=UPI000CFDFADB|nr:response regulator transcription factor [Brucella pseudogrignonensis]MQP40640.1 response regulator [Ochrobactrum sp. MYb237]PQZ39024.1 DNA-binding response regulator [Brucella pseudogrignonensis]PRA40793.1 DNA-binding response regulator [Brucella pseudogrignonensis]PRA69615.1 DNA-binding response regulator [Brucella pseudogrignonensis]